MHSARHRFIYLHVPKTAGNTIQAALMPLSDDRKVTNPQQDSIDRFSIVGKVTPRKHATLADYEVRQPGIAVNNRVVLSVRHPFQRAVSLYFSPSSWGAGEVPVWDEARFWTMLHHTSFATMTDFIRLPNGVRLPDQILRYESLKADFDRVVAALGLPASSLKPFLWLNKSAGSPNQKHNVLSSAVLRRAVEDFCREDMAVFGYDEAKLSWP
jgi:hypothetical protein